MNTAPLSSPLAADLRVGTSVLGGVPFNPAALRHAPPAEQRKAVAKEFEAIFVRQLLGKTMEKMFESQGDTSGSIYGGMLADVFAQQLTAGQGIGLAHFLEQQLTPAAAAKAAAAQPAATSPSSPS